MSVLRAVTLHLHLCKTSSSFNYCKRTLSHINYMIYWVYASCSPMFDDGILTLLTLNRDRHSLLTKAPAEQIVEGPFQYFRLANSTLHKQIQQLMKAHNVTKRGTRSSTFAARPCDASYMLVVSFNSTIQWRLTMWPNVVQEALLLQRGHVMLRIC